MASTRQRSHGGDNHAASIIDESIAVLTKTSPPAVAESTEDASPSPDTPINRSTTGFCKNCGTNIGEYYNSWHKITGSYYVPALLGSYRSRLKSSGKQKSASRGTAIEGW
jgi:hypothetical protein